MPSSMLLRISRVPLLAGGLMLVAACAGRIPTPATMATAVASTSSTVEVVAPAQSVFDIPDFWASQHVQAARLASLNGGLLVVGFVGNSCDAACTTTLSSMKLIEGETDASVHFVVVTPSSAGSSPETLAAFAKARQLPAHRFTIITANDSTVAKLAAVLTTREVPASARTFASTSTLSVLDFNGIMVQQKGHGVVGPVLEALTLLSNIR